jgi:hypothetical protein
LNTLLFGSKDKLKVDLGELRDEGGNLSSFLHSNLKIDVTSKGKDLVIDSDELSRRELKRTVKKFVYYRKLNNKYWVALEGSVVKINRFKRAEKHKRKKKGTTPAIITHGW